MPALPPNLLTCYPDLKRLEVKSCDSIAALTLGPKSCLEYLSLYNCPALKDVVPCLPATLKELHVW
jgi:hypothetical protein